MARRSRTRWRADFLHSHSSARKPGTPAMDELTHNPARAVVVGDNDGKRQGRTDQTRGDQEHKRGTRRHREPTCYRRARRRPGDGFARALAHGPGYGAAKERAP